jgi:hypothetical protein
MLMKEIDEVVLKRLIRDLETAIQVCYTAVDDPDQGYPYAAGYSRSAMMSTKQTLERLL